ncbi:MAG: VWA domain-containing protein [Deltaproteobacteria bacterium]|nr:VWA domain-containing protein [Deltaproteobacteria bacterium]
MRALFLIPLALSACHDSAIVVGGLQEVNRMRAMQNPNLDILFVVDDSPSMGDKQVALAAAFPQMIDVLAQIDGGLPNLHIGVITSDMGTSASGTAPGAAIGQPGSGGCTGRGDDGRLQTITGMNAMYLSDVANNGIRERNYTGELRDTFGQLARVGAGGCGFEQHLSAMRSALTNSANVGFLRPTANLAVVILADEDDCSASNAALFGPESAALGPLQSFRCFAQGVTCDQAPNQIGVKTDCKPNVASSFLDDVEPFVEALLATKADPRMIMVAAIIGDAAPVAVELRTPPGGGTAQPALAHSCNFVGADGPTVADPGVRLAAFLDAFPGRATLTSVCSGDLTNPLGVIGQSAKQLIGDPCLDTTLLADASSEPGVQPSCEVLDIRDSLPDRPTSLAPCAPGATNCYDLLADQVACPASVDHLRVKITRSTAVPEDTWTSVRCQRAE